MQSIRVGAPCNLCKVTELEPGEWGMESDPTDAVLNGDIWYRTDNGFYICFSNGVHAVIAYNDDDAILEGTKVHRLPEGTKLEIVI